MSMTAFALDQCQRGTWWFENDRAKHVPPPIEQSTIESRAEILDYLRTNGRTQAIKVQRHFCYTKSKFYHCVDGLINDGLVIKHRVHFHCVILEAT